MIYAGGAVLIVIMFTAFAYWTAAWTQSAEAAQLTSLPIILIVSAGPLLTAIPDLSDTIRDLVDLHAGRRDVRPRAGRLVRPRRPQAEETTLDVLRAAGGRRCSRSP